MARYDKWDAGFDAGVLVCLGVIARHDEPGSTAYREIVKACGPLKHLIAAAKRDGDSQLPHLRKLAREQRGRR